MLPSSWISLILPKARNRLHQYSFLLRFLPLLTLGEASLDIMYSNVPTELDGFLLEISRREEVLLAVMLGWEHFFPRSFLHTQAQRVPGPGAGAGITPVRFSVADVQELLLLRLERLKSENRQSSQDVWGYSEQKRGTEQPLNHIGMKKLSEAPPVLPSTLLKTV